MLILSGNIKNFLKEVNNMEFQINSNYLIMIPENKNDVNLCKLIQEKLSFEKKYYDRYEKRYKFQRVTPLNHIDYRKTSLRPKRIEGNLIYYIGLGWLETLKQYGIDIPISRFINLKNYFLDYQEKENTELFQKLRWYQKEAVKHLITRIRGIIQAPTGSGKTLIIMALLSLLKPDKKALVIVPKSHSLLIQHLETANLYFPKEDIGYFWSEGKKIGRLIFSTVNSLENIPILNEIDLLIIDECQATPAKTIQDINKYLKNCYLKYGFSATPFGRSDENDFITIGTLGDIIYKVEYEDLKKEGFISEAEYIFVNFYSDYLEINNEKIEVDETLRYLNDYSKVSKYFLEHSPKRIEIILDLVKKTIEQKRNLLIICDRIELANKIFKEIKNKYPCGYITSKTKAFERQKLFSLFKENKLPILIATQLIEYGIDLPNLNTIILASCGKSPIQLIQRIGRGLRKSDTHLIVYDLIDLNNKILFNHYRKRKQIIENLGFPLKQIFYTGG